MRSQSCVSWEKFVAASALILFQVTGVACQRDKVSRIRIELRDLPGDKQAVSPTPVQPPQCLKAGVPQLQLGAPGTGHHKVILTWNASAHSNNPKSDAYGYCLYRTDPKNRGDIKKKANCTKCEQVNQIPVLSTGCVDDVVMDDARYYYVVAAIDVTGKNLSASSNEVPVYIPGPRSVKPAQPSTLPLCRMPLQSQAH